MEDVLTEHENEMQKQRAPFARLSFAASMLTTVLCIIMVGGYFLHINSILGINLVVFARLMMACIVIGFILSIITIVRKEKLKYLKLIGIILNFLYFAVTLIAFIDILLDWKKM